MTKISKTPEESKSNKKKNKSNQGDVSKNKNSSTTEESETAPASKIIIKKPKKKSNGMKKAVNMLTNKQKKLETEDSSAQVHEEDSEIQEPTVEELMESEKPENIKAIVTVRQKKKLKHKQRLEELKNKCPIKEIARNQEYLLKWKNDRDNWKFVKLRQIGIQQTVFDETKISAEVWPIALEYLSGSKGAAKEKITKAAEEVIDEIDRLAENAGDGDVSLITSSEKYRRARELLQSFD